MKIHLSESIVELVWCPPGQFWMGTEIVAPANRVLDTPRLHITLTTGFWIASTPITHHQWSDLVNRPYDRGTHPDSPISHLDWNQSRRWCERLTRQTQEQLPSGYRFDLPSEAQWEYACRAGTETRWHFGDEKSTLSEYAWYGKSYATTRSHMPAVATKKPNPWGLYDCYGLVEEWCLGGMLHYAIWDQLVDPVLDATYIGRMRTAKEGENQIVRGGAIYHNAEDCRSGFRTSRDVENSEGDLIGFRPVLTKII
jgi:formylglycine-generating enzyme required for sulfatase activity